MIRFLKGLVLLPVAVAVVLLAVANREAVRVSFDPFTPEAPVFSATLPLYVVLFVAVALGVVVGGIGSWLGQGTTRRRSRDRRREIRRLEGETERLRAAAPATDTDTLYGLSTPRTALPAPR